MAKKQSSKKAGSPRKVAKARTTPTPAKTRERDPRLPAAGTVIVRTYKGTEHRVKVLQDGLEHEGTTYRSMTALARAVTGYAAISGPAWLGLTKEKVATSTLTAPKSRKSKKTPAADAAVEPTAPVVAEAGA